jgi:hypothetical protein
MRKKNNVVGGTETAQAEDLEKKTYEEPGQCGSSANFLSGLSTKESCSLVRVEKEKKAKENTPSHDEYLSLSPSPKGFGTMAIMEVDEGKKIYDKLGHPGSSANSLPAPLDKGSDGFAGGGKKNMRIITPPVMISMHFFLSLSKLWQESN